MTENSLGEEVWEGIIEKERVWEIFLLLSTEVKFE